MFNKTTVRDIIWGFDHPLIKLGNDVLPADKKLPFTKFGFFVDVSSDYGFILFEKMKKFVLTSNVTNSNFLYEQRRTSTFFFLKQTQEFSCFFVLFEHWLNVMKKT